MKKAIIILMVLLLLPTTCFADKASIKLQTCGMWTQHRKLNNASAEVDEAWLIGYLSGISTNADIDFMKVIDSDSIKSWMDNYCQVHPLRFLEDGGQAFALEVQTHLDKK